MKRHTAVIVIGGVVAGTAAAGVASFVAWSIIPIGVWTMSVTAVSTTSMNVLRVLNGQLWPTQVVKERELKAIPQRTA